ncbi:hypothetical protein LQD23_15775 [Chromobacterium violaceum]|uniref:hypothetical protein n=1 Tax=Chromobacterium violaceum TaxID=536 RepID=UPI001E327FE7|nr:hypothetical protein [Chromobacterium violaceum]MCD0493746.1 hypothetical protein [Chromobacterium violaceum]
MTTNAQRPKKVYGARGVTEAKIVQARLLPPERYLFTCVKHKLGTSDSNLGRDLINKAMPLLLAEHGLTEWADDILKEFAA